MGKPTGFKEFERKKVPWRVPLERLADYNEVYTDPDEAQLREQGARCMDCGIPFCQSATGCPIDNLIPSGTIWSIKAAGKMRASVCTRPTTSPSSPAASAQPGEGALRTGYHQSAGNDQEHRERDRGPRVC